MLHVSCTCQILSDGGVAACICRGPSCDEPQSLPGDSWNSACPLRGALLAGDFQCNEHACSQHLLSFRRGFREPFFALDDDCCHSCALSGFGKLPLSVRLLHNRPKLGPLEQCLSHGRYVSHSRLHVHLLHRSVPWTLVHTNAVAHHEQCMHFAPPTQAPSCHPRQQNGFVSRHSMHHALHFSHALARRFCKLCRCYGFIRTGRVYVDQKWEAWPLGPRAFPFDAGALHLLCCSKLWLTTVSPDARDLQHFLTQRWPGRVS